MRRGEGRGIERLSFRPDAVDAHISQIYQGSRFTNEGIVRYIPSIGALIEDGTV